MDFAWDVDAMLRETRERLPLLLRKRGEKKKNRNDYTNSRWLDIYQVVNHHSSRLFCLEK